jgi:hypothetical protein
VKFCNPVKSGWVTKAKTRVDSVFGGIIEGVTKDDIKYQTAICQFWNGSSLISDEGAFEAAFDHFQEWRKKGGISQPVSYYIILDAKFVEDAEVPTTLVTIEIDGREAKLKVPQSLAITWVD